MMVHQKQKILEMFTDRTPGESYLQGRLATVEEDNGNVSLIAYGWLKIAEYDESRELVRVFTGHKSLRSNVLTGYINDVKEIAQDRRNVVLSGESPTVDTPNDGTKYIKNYVNFSPDMSSVEKDAVREVADSISLPFA